MFLRRKRREKLITEESVLIHSNFSFKQGGHSRNLLLLEIVFSICYSIFVAGGFTTDLLLIVSNKLQPLSSAAWKSSSVL